MLEYRSLGRIHRILAIGLLLALTTGAVLADSDLPEAAGVASAKIELADAIRSASARQTMLSPEATEALIQAAVRPNNIGTDLTKRQREVLKLMVGGLNNNEIGEKLFLSPSTVSYHVSEILSKLGAANRAEASAIAVQNNLI